MSFTQLILHASLPVQLIMLLLAFMFIYCIYIIWSKWILLKFATRDLNIFEKHFWSGADISKLHQEAQQKGTECTGLEAIFLSGFQEFLRLRNQVSYEPEFVVSSASRAMRATLTREIDELESHLPWLATTGSVSPYFGLFGTVIGVMNSFIALGSARQVTLAQVAPGIAEALIATAIGLMAAIPAVMAYNRFVTQVEKISLRYENFVDEFANILARQYSQYQNQQHQLKQGLRTQTNPQQQQQQQSSQAYGQTNTLQNTSREQVAKPRTYNGPIL